MFPTAWFCTCIAGSGSSPRCAPPGQGHPGTCESTHKAGAGGTKGIGSLQPFQPEGAPPFPIGLTLGCVLPRCASCASVLKPLNLWVCAPEPFSVSINGVVMMVHLCGPPQAQRYLLRMFDALLLRCSWHFLPDPSPGATPKPSLTTAVEQKREKHGCESLGQDKDHPFQIRAFLSAKTSL